VERSLLWTKDGELGVEFARVRKSGSSLSASGIALGWTPVPYRLDYELSTGDDFVTARLWAVSTGDGWTRSLDLARGGSWEAETSSEGEVELPPPGGDTSVFDGSLDCDLALSPLTNTMPVLRHGLLAGGGPVELKMVWVGVPDLSLHASDQTYAHKSRRNGGAIVHYSSGTFGADIEFDAEGFVVVYPRLGELKRGQ